MKNTVKILALIIFFLLILPEVGIGAPEDYYRIDVYVIMDSSNSMKSTDPAGVRYQAFEDLAGKLETGDRIGLFQFGATTKQVFSLTEINGAESKGALSKGKIPRENLVYTDVKDALTKAYNEMLKSYDSEHLPFFIIFTDGDIQPIKNYEKDANFKKKYLTELNTLAGKYKVKNWPIYAINLDKSGKPGDSDLKKASELTGGYMVNINTPEKLNQTFQDVLVSIRKKKVEEEIKIQEKIKQDVMELRVASPDAGEYPLLNNMEIQGEIALNGKRLKPDDPDLKIAEFYAEIQENGSDKKRLDLLDNGTVIKGDMKATDGIYSIFYKPQKEGNFTVTVYASGTYKGTPFQYSKLVKDLKAVPAGKIIVSIPSTVGVTLYPGKKNTITVEAASQSQRTEKIDFSLVAPSKMKMEPSTHYLMNGRKNEIKLDIVTPKNLSVGEQGKIIINVKTANEDTILSSKEISIPYTVKADKTGLYILGALGVIIVLFVLLAAIRFLRKKMAVRRSWLKGTLVYWKKNEMLRKQTIQLDPFKTSRIRLDANFFKSGNQELEMDENIDLEVYSEKVGKGIQYFVTGGVDNILYIQEIPHKTIKLEHELEFKVNSHIFYYNNPKMAAKKTSGINVLQKYDV